MKLLDDLDSWHGSYDQIAKAAAVEIRSLQSKLGDSETMLKHMSAELTDAVHQLNDECEKRLAAESRLGRYAKLEAACREWKPVYESLSYGEPEPMPDDPITAALKELDSAVETSSPNYSRCPKCNGILGTHAADCSCA